MPSTIKKTKKQIEADHPFIKPTECPGAIIDWVTRRDEERDKRELEREAAMLKQIERIIENLFDKYFKKYITMIYTNRIWLILLTVTVAICIGAGWAYAVGAK